jgi:hypothetical protein
MIFSNVVMYFIILSGHTDIADAAQAAAALRPPAGNGAGVLVLLGMCRDFPRRLCCC